MMNINYDKETLTSFDSNDIDLVLSNMVRKMTNLYLLDKLFQDQEPTFNI